MKRRVKNNQLFNQYKISEKNSALKQKDNIKHFEQSCRHNFQTERYWMKLPKMREERLPFSSRRTSIVSSLKCNDFFERSRIGGRAS